MINFGYLVCFNNGLHAHQIIPDRSHKYALPPNASAAYGFRTFRERQLSEWSMHK